MSAINKRLDTDIPKNVRLYGTELTGNTVIPLALDQSGQITVSLETADTLIAKVSGETFKLAPASSILAGYTVVTSNSGGTVVSSGLVINVTIKNINNSGNIWVGPVGVNSGAGYLIKYTQSTDKISINNLNKVYCNAELSGDIITWIAEVQ